MTYRVQAFNPGNRKDFFEFHSRVGGECFCSAWWVDTWEEWLAQSGEENRQLREELLKRGEYDGYLIYDGDKAIGWCQVGAQDRFGKLLTQFNLTLDPRTWAITCFQIDGDYQRQGVASLLLEAVMQQLSQKGVPRVVAFPKIDISLPAHQQWTGPKAMYERAGFELVRENQTRAIYAKTLKPTPLDQISR